MSLMNYAQAAEWLAVPERWLQDQVRAGQAPHTRLGKHVRFTQEHLDAIVRAGERQPAVQPVTVVVSQTQASMRPVTRTRRRARA